MPTNRFYFSLATPTVTVPYSAVWDDIEDAARRTFVATAPTTDDTAAVDEAVIGTRHMLGRQYQVPVGSPRTIKGSIRTVMHVSAPFGTSGPTYLRLVAKVTSADGTTVRGVLADATGTNMFPTSANSATRCLEATLNPVAAQPDDLLVIEVGAVGALSSGTNSGASLFLGGYGGGVADYPYQEGVVERLKPWLELIEPSPAMYVGGTQASKIYLGSNEVSNIKLG